MVRKIILLIIATLASSTFLTYFMDHYINPLNLLNSLFYCSLLLTIIGGAMLVLQGGFFNGMVRSFKRVFQKPNRVERVLDEIEGTREDVSPYNITFTLTIPFLLTGILLLVFSTFFSWLFPFS